MTQDADTAAIRFVRMVAGLTKDGEVLDPETGEEWEMENDDAFESLHSLISDAREILQQIDGT